MSSDTLNKLLNGSRMAVGVASFAAPAQAFRGVGLDARSNPQLPYMTRLFGVRDLVLGAGAVSTAGEGRRRWLQATIAADVGDVAAVLLAHRAGQLDTRGAVMLGLTATAGTALGIAALVTGD